MTKFKIEIYSDPSHAWGAVHIDQAKDLGFANQISRYSFVDGDGFVYLEEDCDLGLLINALCERNTGYEFVELDQSNSPSFVRDLPRFNRFNYIHM